MLAKATMSFYYQPLNAYKNKGDVFEVDPKVFLDLYAAKFVEQEFMTTETDE